MPQKPLEYIYPGILAAQAIHTAIKFRIPDLLASGPKFAAELATDCGVHPPTLERLLRALTSIEMFQRMPDGRYRNSPSSEVLRADHPHSLQAEALFLPASYLWQPLGQLTESVRTGKPAFDLVHGQNFFAYLADRPEEAGIFNRVMKQEVLWTTPPLLRAYDFSRFRRLTDVGGGYGIFLSNILSAVPALEGVLYDRPQVVAEAGKFLSDIVSARMKILGGSFFDTVPSGSDGYVLRRVIHDWEDEDAVHILSNVRAAMECDGTLLLVEGLIDSATRPVGLMDLMMLVLGGRERTEADFRKLVQAAGFTLTRVIAAGTYSIVECKPI